MTYFTASELTEMWFEFITDDCVHSDQTENTGFPDAALRIIVALGGKALVRTVEGSEKRTFPAGTEDATQK